MTAIATRTVTLDDGRTLGYRELGSGPPVLLLHGWPTSSFLRRRVMPAIAEHNRVLAMDLPGFGASDKPTDVRYSFPYLAAALDGFLDALHIGDVALAGHDIGGPIAMHWALHRPGRLRRIALLNTLIYPEFSEAVTDFVAALTTPDRRDHITSPDGLRDVMRLGVADPSILTDEVLGAVTAPFQGADARLALANAGVGLGARGFAEIAAALPSLDVPVRVVYGEQDRILPDIAATMSRLAHDVPHTVITPLAGRGHFLQEEAPAQVGGLLASFFATAAVGSRQR